MCMRAGTRLNHLDESLPAVCDASPHTCLHAYHTHVRIHVVSWWRRYTGSCWSSSGSPHVLAHLCTPRFLGNTHGIPIVGSAAGVGGYRGCNGCGPRRHNRDCRPRSSRHSSAGPRPVPSSNNIRGAPPPVLDPTSVGPIERWPKLVLPKLVLLLTGVGGE